MIVRCKLLSETAMPPAQMSAWASGLDLHADIAEPIRLYPGEHCVVPTGIALQIPPGYEGQIRPRSGWAAKHGVTVLNSPGTIDADYRGPIAVVLVNHGDLDLVVSPGDRIAQLVVAPVQHVELEIVTELSSTVRGSDGFGSTGA